MNVQDILMLGDDAIRSMSKKELKEVTTILVSAGNKRLKRLESKAKRVRGEDGKMHWVEKGASGISTDALNKISGGALHYDKFSVKDKNRNQTLQEFARLRDFLNLKTSTVSGARQVRKEREIQTFGATREKILGTKPTPTDVKRFNELIADVYDVYHKFTEINPLSVYSFGYSASEGKKYIKLIGEAMSKGLSSDEALTQVNQIYKQTYEDSTDNFDDIDFLT